ncbi:MAG: hypothetical protein HPQ69_03285 [Marine Group I thaumarchaeote]|nr:MAG: hypothetical protein HPQ69_03285 [Marine Group I thaumarchaeote]
MTDITKSIRFSITQWEQLEEDVKKYRYKNPSDCLRACHELFQKFMSYKDTLNDPNETKKFLAETLPMFQAEKAFDRYEKLVEGLTLDQRNMFFFALSQERNSRIATLAKADRNNKLRMQKGGELIPKVEYRLVNHDDYQYYEPIEPPNQYDDGKDWNKLSHTDRVTLRDELELKLSELEKKYPEDSKMTFILRDNVRKINEQLEKEDKRI